ncbi:MAG: sigma-70 family RNA polymerase sigma factor [Pirellulaceae bacterium]
MVPPSTSTSQIERIKSGDSDSWVCFVELYQPYIYAYARRLGVQPNDASDICQEVFGKLVCKIGDFKRHDRKGSFRRWLRVVTHNTIVSQYRLRTNRPDVLGGSEAQLLFTSIAAAASMPSIDETPDEENEVLQRAIALARVSMEETTWLAFYRTTVDGLSSEEVGAELGKTPQAVREAKRRVLKKIHSLLDG